MGSDGLAPLVVGVGALQIVLDLGSDVYWFNSTKIVVLAFVEVIALAVFFIWELTDKDPIVDLRLFRHRNFAAGTIALVLAYAAFFAVALIIPLWLQRNLGYTAIWAGLATRSEEHTSELQSLMRISYAVFCLKKKTDNTHMRRDRREPCMRIERCDDEQ